MQIKRTLAAALAAFFMLAMSIPALAAPTYTETPTGVDIVINGDEPIENSLRYGKITVTKYGEALTGATTAVGADGVTYYTPVYTLRPRAGATFEIRAAETITDISSAVVYTQNQLVDTVTTGADGTATTIPLHLGTFRVKEITAPFGLVLNPAEQLVTLDIEDEMVDTYFSDGTSLTNPRQTAMVSLKKRIETPKVKPEGFAPQLDISFTLYARADVLDDDGDLAIPAGGAIERFYVDGEGVQISDDAMEWIFPVMSDLPFGSFFVSESSTNTAYVLNTNEYDFVFGNTQTERGDESFWGAVASVMSALFG